MNHPVPVLQALKRPLPADLVNSLRSRFGSQFSVATAVREHHGRDESPFPMTPPDAVVFALSTQDVVDAVKQCAAHKIPLIAFGAGSSLEGHLLAIHGGVSIDVAQMNKVLSINAEDLTVTVRSGRLPSPKRPATRRRCSRWRGVCRASGCCLGYWA